VGGQRCAGAAADAGLRVVDVYPSPAGGRAGVGRHGARRSQRPAAVRASRPRPERRPRLGGRLPGQSRRLRAARPRCRGTGLSGGPLRAALAMHAMASTARPGRGRDSAPLVVGTGGAVGLGRPLEGRGVRVERRREPARVTPRRDHRRLDASARRRPLTQPAHHREDRGDHGRHRAPGRLRVDREAPIAPAGSHLAPDRGRQSLAVRVVRDTAGGWHRSSARVRPVRRSRVRRRPVRRPRGIRRASRCARAPRGRHDRALAAGPRRGRRGSWP
jgi:hypothetical protein